jgi:periplasmic copper chaperone A
MRLKVLQLALASTACWLCASSSSGAAFSADLEALPSQLAPVAEKAASEAKTYTIGQLVIEAPWTRVTPGGAQVAGGYLKITNKGTEADRLVGGTLPVAGAVEVHEMAMTDGIMKMRRLEKGLEIKPGQTVELKPGNYHLMFTGLREGLKEGPPIKGTLVFEKAGSVEVEFRIAPIGARSGASGGHMHH